MGPNTQDFRKAVWLFTAVLGIWSSVFCLLAQASAEPLYTLSVTVSETHPEQSIFSGKFVHPATGENLEYQFQVTDRTGMNGLKHVRELKLNDILQIDYFKTADGSLFVEYMARVQMSGAPEGLDQFNPADLLKKK